jgi:hypothetical protein
MPLYYFDVRTDGFFEEDVDGQTFPSLLAAQEEATRTVTELSSHAILQEGAKKIAVEVRELAGPPVLTACLTYTLSKG